MYRLQKVQQVNDMYTIHQICAAYKKYSKLTTFTLTPNMYRLQKVQQANDMYTVQHVLYLISFLHVQRSDCFV